MKTTENIFQIITKRYRRPFTYKELCKLLNVSGKEKILLGDCLEELVHDGKLVRSGASLYSLATVSKEIKGIVSCHRDGYGFLIPDDPKENDVFLPPHTLHSVYDGDTVAVRITKQKNKKREGEIIRILDRAFDRLLGKVVKRKGKLILIPHDPKLYWPVMIVQEAGKPQCRLSQDMFAIVKIVNFPEKHKTAEGVIVEVVQGDEYELAVKSLLIRTGIAEKYPLAAQKEANRFVTENKNIMQMGKRSDLRHLQFVTIDGEKARDFDDAVCVVRENDGFRLYVSIADVSYYVNPGTALDKEAVFRGNSYYFPDRAVPMLPEALANDLCSLKPLVDRLAFTIEILYDRHGNKRSQNFYHSVIKSNVRLTYEKVEDVLSSGSHDIGTEIARMLIDMRSLMEVLFSRRYEQGSIDFDLPEPDIIIDFTGRIENIVRAKRLSSHRIVEEFMIAANEAVGEWFIKNDVPTIYRVHEKPDHEKINSLNAFFKHLGYQLPAGEIASRDLQKVVRQFRNSKYEKLVNTVVLRSMKQARYSSEPLGHFGLSLQSYLHFTSPIRRYADLVVHRNLSRYYINKVQCKEKDVIKRELAGVADWISKRERLAWEFEKDMYNFCATRFMKDKLGDTFDGIISSITPGMIFVELQDIFIEGGIPVEMLRDDYYEYDEKFMRLRGRKKKRMFYIGKEIKVKVVRVDLLAKKIEFQLLQQEV